MDKYDNLVMQKKITRNEELIMKATYKDFIEANPNCGSFAGRAEARLIFEFLSRDESIIAMLDACDMGKPALTPVARGVEELLEQIEDPNFSFEKGFHKQAVGLMVKSILKPFGYVVGAQKVLPKASGAKYFTSASCYKYDPTAPSSMRVVKRIETC